MNYQTAIRILSQSHRKIIEAYNDNKLEQAVSWMIIRANALYELQTVFYDGLIENTVAGISDKILSSCLNNKSYNSCGNRIVYYDSFCRDRKGLSNQYVNALISTGMEFLLITENTDFEKTEIYQCVNNCPRANYYIVPSKSSPLNKIVSIFNIIYTYCPSKLVLQLLPWSIPALVAISYLPKEITRINVNITDHAYWAGASLMDYNIEFRKYGEDISIERRGFNIEQEKYLPYYPYIFNLPFSGYGSIQTEGKVVLFWGGALYKVYDENFVFFELISKVLNKHENVICICAGGGNPEPLLTYIKKKGLEAVWHYIGTRDDIYQVIENCDIYVNTYPLGGGLMCQYAAMAAKPILAYGNPEFRADAIEGVLNTDQHITFFDETSFLKRADDLISNKPLRDDLGKLIHDCQMTPEKFCCCFKDIVNNCRGSLAHKSEKDTCGYETPINKIDFSIEGSLIKNLGLKSFLLYPKSFIWSLDQFYHRYVKKNN